MSPQKTFGTKYEVEKGKAKKTPSGLTKKDFFRNKWGKLVSRKASAAAKRNKSNLGQFLRKRGDGFKLARKMETSTSKRNKKSPSRKKSKRRSSRRKS